MLGMLLWKSFQYYFQVFMLGFAFGVLRAVILLRCFTETTAILLELPCMLIFSWYTSKRIFKDYYVISSALSGAGAFAMLQASELLLAVALAGQTLQQFVNHQSKPPHLYGLIAQLMFGLIPMVQAAMAHSHVDEKGS